MNLRVGTLPLLVAGVASASDFANYWTAAFETELGK
jgi:hypothetical protein